MERAVRVLVLEDEPILLDLLVTALAEAGFEVLGGASGEAGLALFDREPDLLFTDIRMPGALDGWEVAHRFRAAFPGRPVLYASGFSPQRDLVAGSLFLRKPYRLAAVVAAIQALTRVSAPV